MPISRRLLPIVYPEAITQYQKDRTVLCIYNNDPAAYIIVNDAGTPNMGMVIQPGGLLMLLKFYGMQPEKIWYATGSAVNTICDILELYGETG